MQTYDHKEYKRRAKLKKTLKEKGYSDSFLKGLRTFELEEIIKQIKK